jgi:hypothetical protein
LNKSEPRTTSSRVIVNIFKKARDLYIPIPTGVLPDQTPEQTVGTFKVQSTVSVDTLVSTRGLVQGIKSAMEGWPQNPDGSKTFLGVGLRQMAAAPARAITQLYRTCYDRGTMKVFVSEQWVKAIKNAEGIFVPEITA